MLFRHSPVSNKKILAAILLFICISTYSLNSYSTQVPVEIAQAGSKASGNEMLKAVLGGADFKGMTKQEIVSSYGEPWQKDTTGEKGRYDQKWTYSCETEKDLTYDCVFLYFMADRVVDVENF